MILPKPFLSARLYTYDTNAIVKIYWSPRAALLMTLFIFTLVQRDIPSSTTLLLYFASYTLHLGGIL